MNTFNTSFKKNNLNKNFFHFKINKESTIVNDLKFDFGEQKFRHQFPEFFTLTFNEYDKTFNLKFARIQKQTDDLSLYTLESNSSIPVKHNKHIDQTVSKSYLYLNN
jgi:hypothetical protein